MATKAEIILQAKDQTQAAFAAVSRSMDGITSKASAIKGGLAGIGVGIAAAFAFEQFKGAVDLLDSLDDLAEKTGISAEKLGELRFAGEATGTPLDALTSGISRLSKQMAEAAGGNKEAIATFKTLGVEVKNADGTLRDSDEVLGDLADKFASYEDGAAKAALAQRIFGKSGAEMIPLLNQGRQGIADLKTEAEQLGVVIDGRTAKAAATFNDNLTKIKLSAEGSAVTIAGPLIQSLANLSDKFLEARKSGGLLSAWFETYKEWVKGSYGMLPAKKFEDPRILGNPGSIASQVAAWPRAAAPIISDAPKEPKAKKEKNPTDDAKRYIEGLDKQIERVHELSEVEKLVNQIRSDAPGTWTESMKRAAFLKAADIDATKEQAAVEKDQARDRSEASKRVLSEREEALQIISRTSTPLEAYNQALERLNELYREGHLPVEAHSRAVKAAAQDYEEAQKRIDDVNNATLKQAADATQSFLGNGLADALDGNFKNIGANFSRMLKRMVAEAAAAKIVQGIFGDKVTGSGGGSTGGSAGGGTNWVGLAVGVLGKFFGFDKGGYTGPGGRMEPAGIVHKGEYVINAASTSKLDRAFLDSLNGYAEGGYVSSDSPAQPSMFAASRDGMSKAPAGQGISVSSNYRIQIDARSDKGEIYAGVQKMIVQNNKAQDERLKRLRVLPQ